MPDPIIKVEALGKRYQLQHQARERYTTFRDVLARKARGLFRRPPPTDRALMSEDFWALKDLNFEVQQGEVVGIIGRNGAGKSTLLKVLSRITEPTTGRITLGGRVASLLEVGTGFHPELTGRENIFLNGAILGMRKAEIKAKFDEIVAFAEVERFLDTPVKRYSSGMYVRLAFAVAAHLEPEILIVDEVLAVGDAEFQNKCLGKMKDIATGSGRTVLFVSHQLGMIKELCSKAIVMSSGRMEMIGQVTQAINHYLNHRTSAASTLRSNYLLAATGPNKQNPIIVEFNETLHISIALKNIIGTNIAINLGIRNEAKRLISLFSTNPHDGVILPKSGCELTFKMPYCRLAPGNYTVDVAVTDPGLSILEEIPAVLQFSVSPKAIGGSWPYEARYGDYFAPHEWSVTI